MNAGVVIVNYRTPALTVDCLASIEQTADGEPPRTIVVENKSPDDSVVVLQNAIRAHNWGGWVELIEADENGGFAAGNNIGIRRLLGGAAVDPSGATADPKGSRAWAQEATASLRVSRGTMNPPDAILLLNPDTIVRPGAIQALCGFLDAHPDVALAGSRLEEPDATPQRSAFVDPSPLGEFESAIRFGPVSKLLKKRVVAPPVSDEPRPTDWVAGASLLIRREVFEKIGLLDDRYFMYYEEVDFCRRARKAGFACWYVPASRVVHLVGQASGVVQGKPARRPRWWFDSRRRYFITHFGRLGAIGADAAWFLGSPLYHLKRMIQRKPNPDPQRFLRDLLANSALLRGLDR